MAFQRTVVLLAAFAAGFCAFSYSASADETGFATIHPWKKVGRKTCFSDGHLHYGNSDGHRSKKRAMRAAIKDWQEFTAFEYGTDWAYFKNAIAKTRGCSNGSGSWGCSVEGTPCKRNRRRR